MELKRIKLNKLLVLHDSKRIPLSSLEREKRRGAYPYYGATGIIDYVDDYLFDGRYILLAEDGSVQTKDGKPVLQLPNGKFWVSNHAHIITNSNLVDFDYLYYLLSNTNITSIITGAVQPKVSQFNLMNLDVLYCEDLETQRKISYFLSNIDNKINVNNETIKTLEDGILCLLNKLLDNQNELTSVGDNLYIKGRIGWKGLKKEEYLEESDFRIINGESLCESGIDWSKTGFISEERYEESPEIMLQEGDILLSKDGTIGKLGYVDELEKKTTVASGIFVIRNLPQSIYSNKFVF